MFKRLKKCSISTISKTNPNYFDFCLRLICKIEEIFVFGDDDPLLSFGIEADIFVGSCTQADVQDVNTIVRAVAQVF
ncbi:MAG: hypothetical protein DMG65_10160 [Candidatus Angelobacter sp. Gp1-AA117]|nr:MAG: hypothetical protein DMG65_10160 [Candidatus Angelobacter sp. Gp1-AA117]